VTHLIIGLASVHRQLMVARHGQRRRLCSPLEQRSTGAVQVNSRIWALEKERMAADSTKMAAYVEALHLRRPPSVQVTV